LRRYPEWGILERDEVSSTGYCAMANGEKTGKKPTYQKPEIIDFEYDTTDYALGRTACSVGSGAGAACLVGSGAGAACIVGSGAGAACSVGAGPTSS
jgi:hypothetical protein